MKGAKPKLQLIEGDGAQGRCPPVPPWLSDHAKAEWRRVAPELNRRGMLAEDTRGTVEAYCVAAGMVRETEETLIDEGRIVQTEKGPIVHPAFRIQQGAMREARLLATELALTPHRRPKNETRDELSDLDL